MENGFFEDVFPIENGYIHCYVGLLEGITWGCAKNVVHSGTKTIASCL